MVISPSEKSSSRIVCLVMDIVSKVLAPAFGSWKSSAIVSCMSDAKEQIC